MISLTGIFNRFMNGPALSPVSIPMREVKDALRLDHAGYFDNADIAWAFGQHLQFNAGKRNATTRSYYTHRAEYFHVGTLTSAFPDVRDMELNVRSAPSISIQQSKPLIGHKKFAAMIQPRVRNRDQLRTPVIFGLTGMIGPEDHLHVDSILMPQMDGRSLEGLISVPVTDQTIRQALAFARLCADQIFSGQNPDCFSNLSQAKRDTRLPGPDL